MPKSWNTDTSIAAASAIENSPTSSGPRKKREMMTPVTKVTPKVTYCAAIAHIAAWRTDGPGVSMRAGAGLSGAAAASAMGWR
jgi:hypothetical protein